VGAVAVLAAVLGSGSGHRRGCATDRRLAALGPFSALVEG
jgi:hypothetical protein